MGVAVYGHYGMPLLAFPTSMGDEHEQEGQGMIRTLSPYIDQGRIRIFCINGVQSDSFANKRAHPFHRSWMQAQYDAYVAEEVFPFIDSQCQTPGIPIATLGASLGAYHAANTLFKHPDHVKRCYALSGVYDLRDSMDGMYDDNFYFNNPVDYMANQNDPWFLHQYGSCDIHLATGCGPWEVADLPNVRGAQEPRHTSSSRRLGSEGRTRMALLASPDVGVRGRAFLKKANAAPSRRRSAARNSPAKHRFLKSCERQPHG
jgi:esterase/lipase superfamily enzyme